MHFELLTGGGLTVNYWLICCCFYQVNIELQSQCVRLRRYDNSGMMHFGKLQPPKTLPRIFGILLKYNKHIFHIYNNSYMYTINTIVIKTATSCDVSRTIWRLVFNNIRCSLKTNLQSIIWTKFLLFIDYIMQMVLHRIYT